MKRTPLQKLIFDLAVLFWFGTLVDWAQLFIPFSWNNSWDDLRMTIGCAMISSGLLMAYAISNRYKTIDKSFYIGHTSNKT